MNNRARQVVCMHKPLFPQQSNRPGLAAESLAIPHTQRGHGATAMQSQSNGRNSSQLSLAGWQEQRQAKGRKWATSWGWGTW